MFFLIYGHLFILAVFISDQKILLLSPACIAFFLYFWVARKSAIFNQSRWRTPLLLALALIATFVSFYLGGLWAVNTYGE
jgi:hypothetical protein